MKFIKLYTYSLLSLFILTYSAMTAAQLPDLKLQGDDQKTHQLSDYIGKGNWTLVVVWGPKCPACMEEMPEIQRIYDDRATNKINVLGLAIDYPSFEFPDIKQVLQFKDDYFIDFPNLLISADVYYELELGPLRGTPTILILDPKGNVSATQLGRVPRDVIENYIAKQAE